MTQYLPLVLPGFMIKKHIYLITKLRVDDNMEWNLVCNFIYARILLLYVITQVVNVTCWVLIALNMLFQ